MLRFCGVSPIEYSSGRRRTRRLNYGGDRQANAALYRIVFSRVRHDPRTQAYYERRTQEGKTRREIIRCLKRYAAREVFNLVNTGAQHPRVIGASVRRERVWRVSETPPNTLQYRFDGPEDAPVLVLGPSLGTTWHMWDRQIPELTKQWRVFRFDLPGHGGAPAHPAASVTDLADRLLATLDALGVQRFGYAGCSHRRRRRRRARAAPPATGSPRSRCRRLAPLRHGRRVPPARGDRPHQRPRPDRPHLPRALVHPRLRRRPARDRRVGRADGPHHRPRLLHRGLRGARRLRRPCRARPRSACRPWSWSAPRTRSPGPPRPAPWSPASRTPGSPLVPGASHLAPVEQPGRRHRPARTALLHRLAGHPAVDSPPASRAPAAPATGAPAPPPRGARRRDRRRPARPEAVAGARRPVRRGDEGAPRGAGRRARGPGAGRGRRLHRRLPGASSPATPGARSGPGRASTAAPAAVSRSPRSSPAATWTSSPSTSGPPCATGSPPPRSRRCCSRPPSTAASRRRTARSQSPSGHPGGDDAPGVSTDGAPAWTRARGGRMDP